MENEKVKQHPLIDNGASQPQASQVFHHVGEVPDGALFLSQQEVLEMQYKVIENWKPRKEMWPFTYGVGIMGGLTAISGAVFNNGFRRKMKLFRYKGFTTITASCMVPCITSMIYQVKNVMNPILLRDYDCPMCITSRAATGQSVIAAIQTPFLAFVSCSSVATLGFRYTMPPIRNFAAWSQKAWWIVKPYTGWIAFLFFINGWYGGVLAHKQMERANMIHRELLGSTAEQTEKLQEKQEKEYFDM